MTDASTSAPPPAHSFRPQSAEALWRQISTPHPTVGKARHLGEALVHAGLLSTPDLAEGLQAQQEERGNGVQRPIGQILVDRGALTQDQLRSVIATWLGEYTVHPGDITPEASALALIPRALAERESVLPLIAREDALVLLMADPWDRVLIDEIRFLTQRRLIPLRASPGTLMPAIHKAYRTRPADAGGAAAGARATSQELLTNLATASPDADTEQADVISESDNTLVRLINSVIDEAISHRASDIHIETEPAPHNVRVRLRIDGDLVPYLELPARYRFAMVARIKIMASMDISEHRKPQDGKIDFGQR